MVTPQMRSWTSRLVTIWWFFAAACSSSPLGPDGGHDDADVRDDADLSEDGEDADLDIRDADFTVEADLEVCDSELDHDDPESASCPAGWSDTFDEASELFLDQRFTQPLPECASVARFMVLPAGMRVRLDLEHLPAGSYLEVRASSGELLASEYTTRGALSVELVAPRSGEVRMTLRRPDGLVTHLFTGGLFCLERCELESSRYPIVLVHGMGGTDEYFGFLDYYYQVPDTLRDMGYAVYTPVTPLVGHSSMRAEILAEQIDEILAETGAAKVHLHGHSQGGLDIRVLVSGMDYADRIASTTTYATPNHGLRVELPEWLTGMNFNESYIEGEFLAIYPDEPSVPGFSWAGRSCAVLDFDCQERSEGEVVIVHLAPSLRLVQYAHRDDAFGGANDGLVPVASAMWREFLGVVFADHYDEVGQIADEREGPFDHIGFFINEARRLRLLEIEEDL
jgi:triacylglycerol lipase